MKRLLVVSIVLLVAISAFAVPSIPIQAAHSSAFERELVAEVTSHDGVTLAASANASGSVIGTLDRDERVIVIGRDANSTWLRVDTQLGIGYVSAASLQTAGALDRVPVVAGDLPDPGLPSAAPVDDPAVYPIMPTVTQFTQTIYSRGLALGNHPDVFSKIGDCMTADLHLFLGEFGRQNYRLGTYTYLQNVIDYYRGGRVADTNRSPFEASSEAAYTGFNVASIEDPVWSNPHACESSETPLACEYRRSKPSIALIMFGTNDVNALTPTEFDFFLRLVVSDSIEKGVVPLLMTFPGDPYRMEKSHQLNQIIFQVGRDYDVPVMNLWLALQALPNGGRNAGSMYLSRLYKTQISYFTPANLRYGTTLRNLLTLQSLDILWRGLIKPS